MKNDTQTPITIRQARQTITDSYDAETAAELLTCAEARPEAVIALAEACIEHTDDDGMLMHGQTSHEAISQAEDALRSDDAETAGRKVGRAIAREVLADPDMPRKWSDDDLDTADGAVFTAAGIVPYSAEWYVAVDAAKSEYLRVIQAGDAR